MGFFGPKGGGGSGIKPIQSGTYAFGSNGTANITITAVDQARTRVYISVSGGASDKAGDQRIRARLTSPTNLELYRALSGSFTATEVTWWVWELESGCDVQTAIVSISGAATADITINAVDLSRAEIFVTNATNGGDAGVYWRETEGRAHFAAADTVRVTRQNSGSLYDVYAAVFVVEYAA